MALQFWGCWGSLCFSTTPRPPFCCPERGHCAVPSPAARAGRAGPRSSAPARPACASAAPAAPRGAPAPLRAAGRAAPHPPVRTRGAAPGAGFAFHVEGKRCKSALFRLPLPRAMRRRIKSREIGRAARGLRGGVYRGMRSPPRPPVNSGAKPGPGAAGSIGALMVQ